MPACPSCAQDNPQEANFCVQCGQALAKYSPEVDTESEPISSHTTPTSLQLWETFIGPSKSVQFSVRTGWSWRPAFEYYKEKFGNLETPEGPRFALSWNWPAALCDSFLWFLYRKMYMYAGFYLIFPFLAVLFTQNLTVVLVSQILAGASANFLYYWHCKDGIQRIMSMQNLDDVARSRMIREEGGVQWYVLCLGPFIQWFYNVLLFSISGVEIPFENIPPMEGTLPEGSEERLTPKFY